MRAATIAGSMTYVVRAQRHVAPTETRRAASQNASRYSRVYPTLSHASPRFADQRSEANVHAV